jgi:7,8-dihydropterin-6-yl-methyl-4-(beta-D-ribofuranosyl)aminobenzene 5'-phosphate synthase
MNKGILALKETEKVTITTLMDNYVNVLLEDSEGVSRPPRSRGDEVPTNTLVAEHGLAQFLSVLSGGKTHCVLFDAGYTPFGVLHNLDLLEIDLKSIEAIVLSHGHMDHTGSLYPLLERLGRSLPVVAHPDAFHSPRYITFKDGRRLLFPSTLKKDDLLRRSVNILESQKPLFLAEGTVLVTGEVERTSSFEKGLPNAVLERDGREEKDLIRDDQALVLHLKGKGLVIVSGCAHAGIINTILYARKITGVNKIHAVIGGFHLSGPAFEPIIEDTVQALRAMRPKIIVPMHCTGWQATQRFAEAFPEAFVLNSVGTTFTLS